MERNLCLLVPLSCKSFGPKIKFQRRLAILRLQNKKEKNFKTRASETLMHGVFSLEYDRAIKPEEGGSVTLVVVF